MSRRYRAVGLLSILLFTLIGLQYALSWTTRDSDREQSLTHHDNDPSRKPTDEALHDAYPKEKPAVAVKHSSPLSSSSSTFAITSTLVSSTTPTSTYISISISTSISAPALAVVPSLATPSTLASVIPSTFSNSTNSTTSFSSVATLLPVLPEYQQTLVESTYCAERFGLKYLENLSNTSVNYCDASSAASLNCFHSKTAADGRVDPFCVGGPATYDKKEKKFQLSCRVRDWTAQEIASGTPRLEQFRPYWYNTGPRILFDKYIKLDTAESIPTDTVTTPRKFSVLMSREEKITNVWHSLMEIFSLFMTLDVLRTTRDPATGKVFFSTEDVDSTQVLILDDHPQGPFWDLLTLFAKKPIIRMSTLSVDTELDVENIVVPLPGASNPFWQGDWEVHPCDRSDLLHTFSSRILEFYGTPIEQKGDDSPLVLTFIDRKEKRRLKDKESYIKKLTHKYPAIHIDMVDFADFPFADQLKIARRTDILVGVHGAGLTHGMFLPPGSAMVEILPGTLNHKGFRNLAKMLGHQYFSSHAAIASMETTNGDWQEDDIFLEEDRFMSLLDVAIKSMYNRGTRNDDVS